MYLSLQTVFAFMIINAKTVCNDKYIYSVNPSPQPVQTRIKNVFLIPGNFAKKYKGNWRFSMFEIETDIGVYISSSGFPGNPHHQNNGIFSVSYTHLTLPTKA